jgi:hypothetical protein
MLNKSYADIIEKASQEFLLERAKLILSYTNPKKHVNAQEQRWLSRHFFALVWIYFFRMDKTEDIEKLELIVTEQPATSYEDIAKKIFDFYDKENTGSLSSLHDFVSFFTAFLVEVNLHSKFQWILTLYLIVC